MSVLSELKRRKVFKACLGYVVICWLVLQITAVVIPILELPGWVSRLILLMLIFGLPLVGFLSWVFDLTDTGLKREDPAPGDPDTPESVRIALEQDDFRTDLPCCWLALIGTLLAIGAGIAIHVHETSQIGRNLQMLAEVVTNELDSRVELAAAELSGMRSLLIDSDHPDFEAFRVTAERVLAGASSLRAIEWVPHIRDSEQHAFEAQMQAIYPGFAIKTFDENGAEVLAQQREIFYPVSYTVPEVGNLSAIGFDLGSNPLRSAALLRAQAQGRAQVTEVITLVQSGERAVLMFIPVYATTQVPVTAMARRDSISGFLVGVIGLQELMTAALATTPAGLSFHGRIEMGEPGRPGAAPFELIDTVHGENGLALPFATKAVAGKDYGVLWEFRFEPGNVLISGQHTVVPWWVASMGLLASVIAAAVLRWAVRDAARAALVREATRLARGMAGGGDPSERNAPIDLAGWRITPR